MTHPAPAPATTPSARELVAHLRAYGYRHFDVADDYYDWRETRLGKQAAKVDRMGDRAGQSPSPSLIREFYDFVAAPALRGPVGSVQTDDIAQATWQVGEALAGRTRVLDLGCGTGEATTWFARLDAPHRTVLGVDFSPKCIAAARILAGKAGVENVRFEVADFVRGLPDGPFDAAVDMASLQYAGDPCAAMRRVRAALQDGGVLVAVPMLGHIPEVEEYLGWVADAGLRLRRFDWVLARDLGRNVARPLIVAATHGEPLVVDVAARFRDVAALLRPGRVTPLFESAESLGD